MENCINENKIIYVIEQCINQGNNTFVIYPYGTYGMLVKRILNSYYGITELAIVDNRLSIDNQDILCLDDLGKLDGEYIILLASDNQDIWKEIREEVNAKVKGDRTIIDIAGCEMSLEGYSFNLIGKSQQIQKCSNEQIRNIFESTQASWKCFGEQQPYWSVVTHNEFKMQNIDQKAIDKFYMQGILQAARIVSTAIRNHVVEDRDELKKMDILEIGCGCGRVTKHLIEYFGKVVAVDISSGNLNIARQKLDQSNVEFRLVTDTSDYEGMPQCDIVYSYLVLQHNCPPVIEYMITSMMQCVKDRGIVIFQVPTYKRGYHFEYDSYIRGTRDAEMMEMHTLDQKRIFELAYRNDCIPLEVYPDYSTGQADNSTWFVLQKIKERCEK